MKVLDVGTQILFIFSVPMDTSNTKDILEVRDVRLSVQKGAHLSDSDSYTDIGLSSEEEADELDPAPQFRRKYARPAPAPVPDPDPVPPVPLPSNSDEATVRVPKEALQQVHDLLGQLLQGQVPSTGGTGGTDGGSPSQMPPGSNPFNVRRAKEGEKVCQVCKRTFWNTDTLRRHQKTHTGAQRYTCTNPSCGRKLASKRSFDAQKATCGVEKTKFCPRKGCEKLFATAEGLKAHMSTHKKLSKKKDSCPHCQKAGFTREKSLKDHIRFCESNPNKVGPFPCPVADCHRGAANPFNWTRNLNQQMKKAHGWDLKHRF